MAPPQPCLPASALPPPRHCHLGGPRTVHELAPLLRPLRHGGHRPTGCAERDARVAIGGGAARRPRVLQAARQLAPAGRTWRRRGRGGELRPNPPQVLRRSRAAARPPRAAELVPLPAPAAAPSLCASPQTVRRGRHGGRHIRADAQRRRAGAARRADRRQRRPRVARGRHEQHAVLVHQLLDQPDEPARVWGGRRLAVRHVDQVRAAARDRRQRARQPHHRLHRPQPAVADLARHDLCACTGRGGGWVGGVGGLGERGQRTRAGGPAAGTPTLERNTVATHARPWQRVCHAIARRRRAVKESPAHRGRRRWSPGRRASAPPRCPRRACRAVPRPRPRSARAPPRTR